MNQADFYHSRLDFYRKQMGLSGYTQTVIKLAQIDVKKAEKTKGGEFKMADEDKKVEGTEEVVETPVVESEAETISPEVEEEKAE